MFLQSVLQNSSTLGRLGAVTLAAPRLASCTNQRGTKTGATVWCLKWRNEAQVWISSDSGLEQSGKSIPSPLVVEKASSVARMFVLVSKNYFWLSRRNGTIWCLVGKMGVGEMGLTHWKEVSVTNLKSEKSLLFPLNASVFIKGKVWKLKWNTGNSLVSRPRPAFRHLQYRKAVEGLE